MKRMLLGLVIILFTSFDSPTVSDMLKNFHIKAAGVQTVIKFEEKFPQITQDEKVYLAYLQIYCEHNRREYFKLFTKKY